MSAEHLTDAEPEHWTEYDLLALEADVHEAVGANRDTVWLTCDGALELVNEVRRLRAEADAARRFKEFVHNYLDQHGVPHGDPANPHQVEGCRIGARLDLLLAALAPFAAAGRNLGWEPEDDGEGVVIRLQPGRDGDARITERDLRRAAAVLPGISGT